MSATAVPFDMNGDILTGPSHAATAASDPRWKGLYGAAGFGAALSAVLIPMQVAVFLLWPPPLEGSTADWFTYMRANPVVGLLNFDILLLLEEVLLIPIMLALYLLLHRRSESTMLVGTALWFAGTILMIVANTAFEMLALSSAWSAATMEGPRAAAVAAGDAMVASWIGHGTAYTMGIVVSSAAGVLVGVSMLREAVFGRAAAWAYLAGIVLGIGILVPPAGTGLALVSMGFIVAWYILVARTLVQLGRR